MPRGKEMRGYDIAYAKRGQPPLSLGGARAAQMHIEYRVLAELFLQRNEMHRVEEDTKKRFVERQRRVGEMIGYCADQVLRGGQ